ncbi:MAG: type II toxin-antitoxin system VapC family toxin [Candidatus Bathyarchaeia archaeon]
MILVLDANVLAKWFIEEEDSDKALEIRDQYVRGKFGIVIPTLSIYELGNTFWKHPTKTPEDVGRDFTALGDMGLVFEDHRDPEGLASIFDLAKRLGITFYDAVYVNTALKRRGKFVTADEGLYNKVKESVSTSLLKDWGT